MTTSELGLIYKMRKEKREEERKKREQQQQQLDKDEAQIQSRVNTLRQSNMQNAQNLKTIGGAVAHGVLAGTSEALTEKALKRQQFKEYLDEMTNAIAEEKRNFQQIQISTDWLRQNYNGLGAIVSFLPQMGAVRARRAIQPYIDDLGQALGENADITDINTETGMITVKTDKNELEQMNLYDMFP